MNGSSRRGDTFAAHVQDTIVAGAGLNHLSAVEITVKDAPARIAMLREAGAREQKAREHEATITAVASTTSLTIDTAPADALDKVKYVVTDPADIDEGGMMEYLYRECEQQWRTISRSSGGPMSTAGAERREYELAFTRAREADSKYSGRRAALRDRRTSIPWGVSYQTGEGFTGEIGG